MNPEELAAIRARADAATEGPPYDQRADVCWRCGAGSHNAGAMHTFEAASDLLAQAREDIPRLLGEIERLRARDAQVETLIYTAMTANALLAFARSAVLSGERLNTDEADMMLVTHDRLTAAMRGVASAAAPAGGGTK